MLHQVQAQHLHMFDIFFFNDLCFLFRKKESKIFIKFGVASKSVS